MVSWAIFSMHLTFTGVKARTAGAMTAQAKSKE